MSKAAHRASIGSGACVGRGGIRDFGIMSASVGFEDACVRFRVRV